MAYKETFGLSVSALKNRLRDNPSGCFLFYGPEELLKQFYLQKFVQLIEKEGSAEFNLSRLDFSRDHTVDDLLGEAEILPFMGERRLVVVRGFSPQKLNDGEIKKLTPLLESFPDYLTLVFYLEKEEFQPDKQTLKKKGVMLFGEKANFVSFPLQEERVLLPWSRKILAKDGIGAQDSVLRVLFRLCGNQMTFLRQELEKLSAYALSQEKTEITEEDVLLFAHDTAEFAVNHLCDAVLDGSADAVAKIFANLKNQDVAPIFIAGAVARMLTGALLCVEGADLPTFLKATKSFPWQYDRIKRFSYRKKRENLEKALEICLDLDRKLKGARSDEFLVTELCLFQIAALCKESV